MNTGAVERQRYLAAADCRLACESVQRDLRALENALRLIVIGHSTGLIRDHGEGGPKHASARPFPDPQI